MPGTKGCRPEVRSLLFILQEKRVIVILLPLVTSGIKRAPSRAERRPSSWPASDMPSLIFCHQTPFFRGSLNALAGEHVCSLDGCLSQAGECYCKHREWACAHTEGCFQVPARQFCCVLICPCSQGLEQRPGAKRAFPYTAQEVSQMCRQRRPWAFGGSTQELTPVVASAPAILHPHGWGRHEGMGAVPCLGTWEGER